MDDFLRLGDAVHFWHVDVREDYMVAYVATRLCHVAYVHVDCDASVDCLIAFFAELALNDCFERHQVEEDIIN